MEETLENETPAPAAPPAEPEPLAEMTARLDAMEEQISGFHRRSEHRELVIDRLHEENQVLRGGIRRAILEPVVTDLMRLYDALGREAERLSGEPVGRLFGSFADDVELALERCGLEVFAPKRGEAFDPSRHTPVGTVPAEDPGLHNTVEKVLGAGFTDQETGRVRRPAKVRFWNHRPAPGADPAPEPAPDPEPGAPAGTVESE
ncbi:nucleotide exchange factor GrpE [Actinocorallia longicatena]|uniref:HSP-70 cofactor n=1 Tax=Actinocorallia longicatena TaxID=111803 RepID=A0ABP6Q0Q9_9ACTN